MAQCKDGGRSAVTEINPVGLLPVVAHGRKLGGQRLIESGLLRWKERVQRVACRLRDGSVHGGAAQKGGYSGVALVISPEGRDRIKHGDMDHGHGAAGAGGPQLFPENTRVARGHRRVIKTARVNGHAIPVTQKFRGTCAPASGRRFRGGALRGRAEAGPQVVLQGVGLGLCKC